jgi:hypothetical protein
MLFGRSDRGGAQPRTVYLHVGHGKTGSSYVQSSLALSRQALTETGISYPVPEDYLERALAGRINPGNLSPGPGETAHHKGTFSAFAKGLRFSEGQSLLVSNENIYSSIAREGFLDEVWAAYPDAAIRVLLFIRNPMDHAISAYQQNVKRRGRKNSLSDYLKSYTFPMMIGRSLEAIRKSDAKLTVLNYSNHKSALLRRVEDWLDAPAGLLTEPPVSQVNRSLTRTELQLQLAFNRHFGKGSARFISDVLCNELPEVRAELPYAAPAALKDFLDRMRELTAPINERLPQSERYVIESLESVLERMPSEAEATKFHFSEEQIEVLSRSLSRQIRAARRRDV